jgi:cysteinyl-tRNA synthetase
MKLHNTLSRALEEFRPMEGNDVRMYTCGPTVYDYAHIGNFRAYMFEDILRRYLKYNDFNVTQVMNLTDIDDKTIQRSRENEIPLSEYTKKYIDAFFEDLTDLNVERAEHYPAATAHVPEMIALISRIMEKGYAYQSDDGSVYFNVGKYSNYGKLAHLDMGGLRPGARVANDEYDKENVGDFALWKAWDENDGDVVWDSPWGRGRPGWHIECSAMSMKYLGESFDIHTGGVDNIFPHHENEMAQSQSATGKELARFWLHCEYLIVDGRKMSKSLGNFFTLRDIRQRGYSGREVRYVLIASHYRQSLNFSLAALDAARSALARIDEFCTRLSELAGDDVISDVPEWARTGRESFTVAMDDDLNAARALAALFGIVAAGNRAMDGGGVSPGEAAAALAVLSDIDRVLGFIVDSKTEANDAAMKLVELRTRARSEKNWAEADRVRDELARLGWTVHDTDSGPRLRRKPGGSG